MASRNQQRGRLFGLDSSYKGWTLGRDTAGDFIPSPDIDLWTIAATLAAGPGPGPGCSYFSAASLASHHKRNARTRKMRPHREEHVKRLRVSHDTFGDQDTKLPLYAVNPPTQQQPLATGSLGTETRDGRTVTTGNGFFSRLCGILGMMVKKMLKKMLFGNGSHA